jgi:hypothetical protein
MGLTAAVLSAYIVSLVLLSFRVVRVYSLHLTS